MLPEQKNSSHKITFVLDSGLGAGGAERVASNLIKHWLQLDHKVALVTMSEPERDFYIVSPSVERIVVGGIRFSSNKISGALHNVLRIIKLRRALKQSGATVVVSFQTRTNIRTIVASMGLGKRVVISERSDTSRQPFGWAWRWARQLLYCCADVITANSKNTLENMRGYVPSSKLAFAPNPLFIPKLQSTPINSTKILNIGRLVPAKRQELIIHALSRLREESAIWQVDILGEGPERAKLTSIIEQCGLTDRIALHGLVKDPSPYYLSAGIFVFPSLYEGTPNALLEAMAYGLPCIVSDSITGALEYVIDGVTGLVFKSGDPADLAEKIAILIKEPTMREQIGSAAREKMQRYVSANQMDAWERILWSQ